jgi:predicted DNA-binding protein YlxM (UPF0122 family)
MCAMVGANLVMRGRGKKRALTPEQERAVVEMYTKSDVPVADIAKLYKVCRRTIYNTLERAKQGEQT